MSKCWLYRHDRRPSDRLSCIFRSLFPTAEWIIQGVFRFTERTDGFSLSLDRDTMYITETSQNMRRVFFFLSFALSLLVRLWRDVSYARGTLQEMTIYTKYYKTRRRSSGSNFFPSNLDKKHKSDRGLRDIAYPPCRIRLFGQLCAPVYCLVFFPFPQVQNRFEIEIIRLRRLKFQFYGRLRVFWGSFSRLIVSGVLISYRSQRPKKGKERRMGKKKENFYAKTCTLFFWASLKEAI